MTAVMDSDTASGQQSAPLVLESGRLERLAYQAVEQESGHPKYRNPGACRAELHAEAIASVREHLGRRYPGQAIDLSGLAELVAQEVESAIGSGRLTPNSGDLIRWGTASRYRRNG